MAHIRRQLLLATIVTIGTPFPACGVDILRSSQPGGPSAQTLANSIVNTGTGVVLVAGSANFTINAFGNPSSDLRAIGAFSNGLTPPGTLLPVENQNAAGNAQYTGGVGAGSGACLCTGFLSDSETSSPLGRGVGVEGPNNGIGPGGFNPGEIGQNVGTPVDSDFAAATGLPGGGDAAVLQFQVEMTLPGFLSNQAVFGSDEYPVYIEQPFNDSFAILINGENVATLIKQGSVLPFSLQDVQLCSQLFKENDVAPAPPELVGSLHAIPGAPLYDVEFGGFTTPLTFETCDVLAPGTYTIKIVVQDVSDTNVDAGLFIPANSLKLYSFLQADFNLNGQVSGDDFLIWQRNTSATDATFTQGDANGDGLVNGTDLNILFAHWGQTGGKRNYCADFDRDNDVDGDDFLTWQRHVGMTECASRAEGDADGDGDVDGDDLAIWELESGTPFPSGLCGCTPVQQAFTAGGGGAASGLALLPEKEALAQTGHPADTDDDGDFDLDDLKYWMKFYGVAE